MTHENRRQRLAACANFEPPKADGITRRDLWKQRKRQRRGKLDPELRRLQKEKLSDRSR